MKKYFTLIAILVASYALNAQSIMMSPTDVAKHRVANVPSLPSSHSGSRSSTSFILDYDSIDKHKHNLSTDSFFTFRWPLSVYNDTSFHFSLTQSAVMFDSLTERGSLINHNGAANTVTFDSVIIALNWINNSLLDDSVFVTLFDKTQYGYNTGGYMTVTPLWQGVITNFLSSGGFFYYILKPTTPVALPAGHTFGLKVDYLPADPTQDTLEVLASFREDCGNIRTSFAHASSACPKNSRYYFNDGPAISGFGIDTTTLTTTNNCKGYYIQNFLYKPYVTVNTPSTSLTVRDTILSEVSCFGGSNGSAAILTSGGTGNYTYTWSRGGANSSLHTGLSAGSITVTVTDNLGASGTNTFSITQPSAALTLAGPIQILTTPTCSQSNGVFGLLAATGGTRGYHYIWSNGTSNYTGKDTVISSFSANGIRNAPGGSYTVVVTDTNGCTASYSGVVNCTGGGMTASITAHTNVSCFGGSNGSATVTALGGSGSYAYAWNGGGNSATKSGLANGTATVTVTDGTTVSVLSVPITQPSAALILAGPIQILTTPTCSQSNGVFGLLAATGGTRGYHYIWSNGTSNYTGKDTVISSFSANGIRNAPGGSYTVVVTDTNGCTASYSGVVNCTGGPMTASITAHTNVSCFGGNNGSATVTALGGSGSYTYTWNGGGNASTKSGLSNGTATVTVTDGTTTSVLNVNITRPSAALTLAGPIVTLVTPTCSQSNGVFGLSAATGGTPGYHYVWSNGTTNTIGKDTVITGFGSVDGIRNAPGGSYTVVVTDTNGCTASYSGVVNCTGGPMTASITAHTNVSCFGGNNGSAIVTALGGSGSYTYTWNGGGNASTKLGLSNGTATVTVTDGTTTSVLNVTITQPSAALALAGPIQPLVVPTCGQSNGTFGLLAATGGTPGYHYVWSNGTSNYAGKDTTVTGFGTFDGIRNAPGGNYTVVVTDTNGCTASYTGNVPCTGGAMTAGIVSHTNVSCFGGSNGSATAFGSGGTGTYTYAWNGGGNQATKSGLSNGIATVTVSDGTTTSVLNVTITQPSAALALAGPIITQITPACGQSNGVAGLAAATGGTPGYHYVWSNGTSNFTGRDSIITGLGTFDGVRNIPGGSYTVVVTDTNGCTASYTGVVNCTGGVMTASITAHTDVKCFGGSNGSATVTALGGSGTYTYTWNGGGNSSSKTGLSNGTATVTVSDGTTTSVLNVPIGQPAAALTASITSTPSSGANGTATVTPAGGTPNYAYNWSTTPAQTTFTATGLAVGSFTVTVTDANSCTITKTVSVATGIASIEANISSVNIAPNPSNGLFNLTVNLRDADKVSATIVDITGQLIYTINEEVTTTLHKTIDITNLASGVYILKVSTTKGTVNRRIVIGE